MAVTATTALIISLTLTVLTTVAKILLAPQPSRPAQQTPQQQTQADGSFSQKQAVPSLPIVLGRRKRRGVYILLEERAGWAYHLFVLAGHRVQGFLQHYLHDEAATLTNIPGTGSVVTTPARFVYAGGYYVGIETRLGLTAETAFGGLVGVFPEFWTVDHRGDGLAQVLMACATTNQENQLKMYPNGMPEHSCVLEGALVYDPREPGHDPDDPDTWEFTRNLALLRLHHLTQPWGMERLLSEAHLPEWAHAADVCDEEVINKAGDPEPRYHGGLDFFAADDPVEIGRKLDQAADLVVYDRPDGTIGVHAGEMVTPDIRLTDVEISSFEYDANRSDATTVVAIRGRFIDPDAVYAKVDAAIYGDAYAGEGPRTATIDNEAVESHNHIQRLQALKFIRANAPRVKITVPFDGASPTRNVTARRFVTVHRPTRGLDEAIVEIVERPRLDLSPDSFALIFEGIVVPATLYAFDAATEEGDYSLDAAAITPTGVPEPENFSIAIASATLSAGRTVAVGVAGWDFLSNALLYELEYQPSDESQPPQSVVSRPGETEVRTPALEDGVEYRCRLRARSNGAVSEWTDYEVETAVADVTAPGQPTDFVSNAVGSDVTLDWLNPNSPNLHRTELYRGSSASFGSAVQIEIFYGGIGEPRSYEDAALASGTYYWWVRSENASDVASTEVGPETQTIP